MKQRPPVVQRLAGAVAMLLVAVGLVVALPSPASASVARVDVSDVYPHSAITAPNGDVTVASCTSAGTLGTKTVDSSGSTIGTTSMVTMPQQYQLPELALCGFHRAVGADGTLYGIDPTGYPVEKVVAYAASGQFEWDATLLAASGSNCTGVFLPLYIQMGSDGNLYVVGHNNWCGKYYLYSYTASGALRWRQELDSNVRFISTYSGNGGGVVLIVGSVVQYFDYNGSLQTSIAVSGSISGSPFVDSAGMLVLTIGRWTQSGDCGWSSSRAIATSILGYTPSGTTLHYEPICSSVNSLVILTNGEVVFSDGFVDTPERIVKLTYDPGTDSTTAQELVHFSEQEGSRTFNKGVGLIADTNGGFLAHRTFTRQNGMYKGAQFRLYSANGDTGAVFNTDEIDPEKSIMVSGETISLAPGQLSFVAIECSGWTCFSNHPHYLNIVQMPKLGMDYPRGTLLGVTPQAFDSMAVVGDSFSAGIGSLQQGQSYTDVNCARSPGAYGPRLAENPVVKLHMPASSFVACSGAVAADVVNNQVGSIPTDTKAVFLTIGGNDVKFSRFGALCIFLDCADPAYDQEFDDYLADLPDKLTEVYEDILSRAQGATVYVMGYPHIMPLQDCSTAGSGGWWSALQVAVAANPNGFKQFLRQSFDFSVAEADAAVSSVFTISNSETLAARNLTNALNLTISDAVDQVGSSRLKFVSTNQPGSPLQGGELCGDNPLFNGLSLDFGGTFHPNAVGQDAMHKVARDALAIHQSQYVLAG